MRIISCCRKRKASNICIFFASRYGPDKDGKIPSTPRSVVNFESVPIWENLAVGDKNSGIGGQKPWLHTKGELNRRKFGFRFLNPTESPSCVTRTIDLALLFLGTGFFDTKQNYHHVLSNAILPMFAALRDAGVISGRQTFDTLKGQYMSLLMLIFLRLCSRKQENTKRCLSIHEHELLWAAATKLVVGILETSR